MLVELGRADGVDQPVLVAGNPIKMSRVAEGPESDVPQLGEHTTSVLGSVLGLDRKAIDELIGEGVISSSEAPPRSMVPSDLEPDR
jgi:crotonobetainyl-CoA:carnitine CoA-transferase CaiB-like acyl-CoA transferase